MGGMSGGGGGGGGGVPWANIGATIGDAADYVIGRRQNALASRAEQGYQNRANKLYTGLYEETKGDYAPYQTGGTTAYAALLKTYGLGDGQGGQADYSAFTNSPDYQFNLQQGQNALDRSAASRGRLYSGAQMQASQRFGQGLASTQLGNYRTGLGNISNMGLSANNSLANYRMGYGNQLGQGYTNLGDIAAAEYLGNANLHRQFNASQKDVWGVGGGSSGGGGGGPSTFGGSNGSVYDTQGNANALNVGGNYDWYQSPGTY